VLDVYRDECTTHASNDYGDGSTLKKLRVTKGGPKAQNPLGLPSSPVKSIKAALTGV